MNVSRGHGRTFGRNAELKTKMLEGQVMRNNKFFAGDRVVVRSPQEILSTLDSNGTLDNHPFMPEMLDYCGKSFRVHRRVEKTCVEAPPPIEPNRRFAKDDVVTLDGLRCDGS